MGIPMEPSMEKEVISIRPLKKDLLIFISALVMFALLDPLFLTLEIYRSPIDLDVPSTQPALYVLALGTLASWLFGKFAIAPLAKSFKTQHISNGVVLDNQNSVFANFGLNFVLGCLIGISTTEAFICEINPSDDLSTSVSDLFNCRSWINSLTSLIAGIFTGLGLALIKQVLAIEKETNKQMMVQYYSTKQWSLVVVAVAAIVVFIIGLAFYKIFTLGQP